MFEESWLLYISAFPEEERRDLEYQLETINIENFQAEAVCDDQGSFVGIIFWWEFEQIRYIEHFATDPRVRGNGVGSKLLGQFCTESTKPIILEVEHPVEEIQHRRIGFYERLGFHLIDFDYSHPSYDRSSSERVSLKLMTYPEPLSSKQVSTFVECNHPTIFFTPYLEELSR